MWSIESCFLLTVFFTDEGNSTSRLSLYIPYSWGWSEGIEFADGIVALLKDLSDAEVDYYNLISRRYRIASPPAVGSDVARCGAFFWEDATGEIFAGFIPSFDEGKLLRDGITIDQTDIDVVAVTAAMTTGLTLTSTNTIQPLSGFNSEDLTSLIEAYLQYRDYRT